MPGPPNTDVRNRHRVGHMNILLKNTLALSIIGILVLGSLSSSAAQERIFENKIPDHIPIKIKIKKEKEESFKNL